MPLNAQRHAFRKNMELLETNPYEKRHRSVTGLYAKQFMHTREKIR
jgi:hypothetical protein